jgi:hypothetical protein
VVASFLLLLGGVGLEFADVPSRLVEESLQHPTEVLRVVDHRRSRLRQDAILLMGVVLTASCPCTSVTHNLAGFGVLAAHKSSDGFGVLGPLEVVFDPICCVFFRASADLADQADSFGFRVGFEDFQSVDEVGACYDVSSHADHQALTETGAGDGCDCFVGEGAGLGGDSDVTGSECGEGLETDAAEANGCDDSGSIGAYEAGLGLRLEDVGDLGWVVLVSHHKE